MIAHGGGFNVLVFEYREEWGVGENCSLGSVGWRRPYRRGRSHTRGWKIQSHSCEAVGEYVKLSYVR